MICFIIVNVNNNNNNNDIFFEYVDIHVLFWCSLSFSLRKKNVGESKREKKRLSNIDVTRCATDYYTHYSVFFLSRYSCVIQLCK